MERRKAEKAEKAEKAKDAEEAKGVSLTESLRLCAIYF